jgi:hypothetical protein
VSRSVAPKAAPGKGEAISKSALIHAPHATNVVDDLAHSNSKSMPGIREGEQT